jgi:hypothetical protein
MKAFLLRIVPFGLMFLLGAAASPDNPMSLWPPIPKVEELVGERKIVCTLGTVKRDRFGGVVKAANCECKEIEE